MAHNQPWFTQDAVAIPGDFHDFPKSLEKFLPKCDPEKNAFPKDHINNFMLLIHLMNVQYEDVVCRLFLCTFEGRASTWYFIFQPRLITSWV